MAGDPVFRCPGCGSLLTAEASFPGSWECRYCACLFPVEGNMDRPERAIARIPDPGPVTLRSL
jgi:ribosomal protein L37AE/L43A